MFAVVAPLAATTAAGDDRLTVALQSGRSFTAAVDARTDDERLWLRFGDDTARLYRPVAWRSIIAAWRADQQIPLDQLRQVAEAMKTAPADPGEPEPPSVVGELLPAPPRIAHSSPFPAPPRISAVTFDVWLANWDADADPDGLVILVRPLDAWGQLVPVAGVVHVELQAAVRRDFDAAPRSRGIVRETVGRWTRSLANAPLGSDGFFVKAPFTADAASHTVAAYRGRVEVRLVVPGHGVFEHAVEGVTLRPWTPLDDLSPAVFSRN